MLALIATPRRTSRRAWPNPSADRSACWNPRSTPPPNPGIAQPGIRDITTGNNGHYHAAPGWDPCTGLGVPDGLLAVLTCQAPTQQPVHHSGLGNRPTVGWAAADVPAQAAQRRGHSSSILPTVA